MQPPSHASRKTILIVDDSETTRQGLIRAAEDAGFVARQAANGIEALAILGSGAAIDLIVLDLLMPMMDGWEFLKLQKRDPALASIPVIVLSGSSDLPERVGSLGAVGVLQKPVEFDRLWACICGFAWRKRPGVLIMDEETQASTMLGRALGHFGFAVWLAADYQQALDIYRQNQQAIDVALLDVMLPSASGPETLAALRQINPRLQCCFMTGVLHHHARETLLALGACAVLEKPFGLVDVSQALREAMRSEKGQ